MLVGAFSVIVKTDCETDGSFYSTSRGRVLPLTVSRGKVTRSAKQAAVPAVSIWTARPGPAMGVAEGGAELRTTGSGRRLTGERGPTGAVVTAAAIVALFRNMYFLPWFRHKSPPATKPNLILFGELFAAHIFKVL